jgi:hypothetical protein
MIIGSVRTSDVWPSTHFFVVFFAGKKCSVSVTLLSAADRLGSFAVSCHGDLALYVSQVQTKLSFLIRGCFVSQCGQAMSAQLTLWCSLLVHVQLVLSPLTEPQTATQTFLRTNTNLEVTVQQLLAADTAVRGSGHVAWDW